MKDRITIEEAQQHAHAMLQPESTAEDLEFIDWIFAMCLQARRRHAKGVIWQVIVAKARSQVEKLAGYK